MRSLPIFNQPIDINGGFRTQYKMKKARLAYAVGFGKMA